MAKNRVTDQNATQQLKRAIMEGNTQKVQFLLENNVVDINAKIRYTNNPNIAEYIVLIWAAEKGYKDIVNLLLKQPGININIKDSQGFTALMCAAEQGHNKVIELLLEHPNINVNIQNNKGATALMLAIFNKHKEVVIQLLNHSTIDINIKTRNGFTALTYANLNQGYEDIVELLLHPKPPKTNVNKQSSVKKNISTNPIKAENSLSEENYEKFNNSDWISKLTRMRVRGEDINRPQDSNGWTILMYATQFADFEIVKKILDENSGVIDINFKNKFENTALTIAAKMSDEKKMKLLLKYGSNIELAKKNVSNDVREKLEKFSQQVKIANNNFIFAILSKNYQKVNVLMENSPIDINARLTSFGDTILMRVADQGFKEAVKILLKHPNINVNIQDGKGITALMCASARGHYEIVKMLLEHEADVNIQDKQSFAALMCASENGHEKIVKMLLEHNAKVNVQGNKGQTALMLAEYFGHMENGQIKNGHMKVIHHLLNYNANVNILNDNGDTVLMLAAAHRCEELVKHLLEHGADIDNKNKALMIATEQRNEKIIGLLLQYGANVNTNDLLGITPLMNAIRNGYIEIVKLLLENGVNINTKVFGITPLIHAIRNGYAEIVKLLLEKGADINTNDLYEVSPLMYAVESGDARIVSLLLDQKQDIDFNMVNYYGETLQRCARRTGREKIVRLIESKIEPESPQVESTQEDISPPKIESSEEENKLEPKRSIDEIFWKAVSQGDVNKMDLLLEEKDVDSKKLVNSRDKFGKPALVVSSQNGHIHVMRSLLEHNADPSLKDDKGDTALLIASDNGDVNAVSLLLSFGADLFYKDSNGDNALIRAAKKNRFDVVEELLYRKAIINAQGQYDRTALMISAENGYIRLVKLLIKKRAKVNVKDKYNKTALEIVNEKIKELDKNRSKKENNSLFNNLQDIKKILENVVQLPPLFEELSIIKTNLIDTWEVLTTGKFKNNLKFWEKSNPDSYNKIQMLVNAIKSDPFRGLGRPELLKGDLKGLYSREIDKKNRLIYDVDGEYVTLISCRGHYEQEKRKDVKSKTFIPR